MDHISTVLHKEGVHFILKTTALTDFKFAPTGSLEDLSFTYKLGSLQDEQ